MSSRTTPKSARGLLYKGLEQDAGLMGDISSFFNFAVVLASPTPLSLLAGLSLVLQTSGSVISAAVNLIGRFRDEDGDEADSLEPYERFNALFLLSVVRAYMEALKKVLDEKILELEDSDVEQEAGPETDGLASEEQKSALEDAQRCADELADADLTYLFGVEPLSGEAPLLNALADWLVSSLVATTGLSTHQARSIAKACDKDARARFRVLLAEDDPESKWMRAFLSLESQSAVQDSIEDLSSTTSALQGWLADHAAPSDSSEEWEDYRKVLRSLPNMSTTMYGESFGVSDVFQAPSVLYHVNGISGEAGKPHQIDDVGKLLGSLVSTRTEGQDLIILSGGPGSGKSTLCRVFASELAQAADAYPVFLQLRRAKEGGEITQFIEESLRSRGLINRISDLLKLPNVVLILDGFDELVAANRPRLRQFFSALLVEAQEGPLRNAHVVVSGRDTLFPDGQGLPPGSHVVSLQPFDAARVNGWGSRWRAKHPTGPGSTFHPELFLGKDGGRDRSKSPLQHLVTWPLTLHLVARVHTAGGLPSPTDTSVPIDKAYLYRSILAETSERQAAQASGGGRLEPKSMRAFLRSVAWMMYTRSVDSLDVADVQPLIEAFGGEQDELDPSHLAEVAVLNAPELAKGEETGFEFVHKSFSEFLAAEAIAENVEKVSFKVEEFGSQELEWRMSPEDATVALGQTLGIRLLPEEIQEMLEPMLGSVLEFREGRAVGDRVPMEERRAGLEAVLDRCEALYGSAVAGGFGIGSVEAAVKGAAGINGALEGFANYLVGLVLIGCAAARQLSTDEDKTRKFRAEPETGALWKFLGLSNAGSVVFDDRLAARLFPLMSVRNGDDGTLEDLSMPWKLYALDRTEGYRSVVGEMTDEMLRAGLAMTQLLLLLTMALRIRETRNDPERLAHARRLWSRDRDWDDFRMETPNEASLELVHVLGRLGAVSPSMAQGWADHERNAWRGVTDALRRAEEVGGGDPRAVQEEIRKLLFYLREEPIRHRSARGLYRLAEEVLMQWDSL